MGVICGGDTAFEGAENITRHAVSDFAERGFCRVCGAHLFFHLKPGDVYSIGAGAFDDQSGHRLVREVCIDRKPGYYDFAQETKPIDEATHLARIAALKG